MMDPVALSALIAGTRIEATQAAIVATLGQLLPGVVVAPHPGKLDINDVVAKAIVAAPGIALGYTQLRELGDVAGTMGIAVDWVAYLVVEDWVDRTQSPPRTFRREVVGHAIGLQLLRILRDFSTASWGLTAIEPPAMDPSPALRPVFTIKTAEQATAIYAVTWSQTLVQDGEPFFGYGGDPGVAPSEGFPDDASFDIDFPDGEPPPELDWQTFQPGTREPSA